jgi:hypothetical protein
MEANQNVRVVASRAARRLSTEEALVKKSRLPSSACKWQSWSRDYDDPVKTIRARLGIKGTKLPKNLHGEWNIDGWSVVVKRSFAKTTPSGQPIKTAKHRIFVRVDGDLIPAGRVRQALCLDDRLDAKRRAQARADREFKRKFDRMTEVEKIAHDAKQSGKSKAEVERIKRQELARRRRR